METPLPNDSSKASLSPPVGGRLRSFRRDWLTNKCSQNVLNIITNGYVLPFRSKPNLIRFPLILSEYKAQQKDQALATCIQSLLSKNAIERVDNVKSLGFYSRLFLVPKPHQRWRPVIDLSRLNTFLHVEKFKMETPESIRTSLIPGEWVASIDLSDAYLHIPIHPSSRKYLRFCYKAQVFQFTSLPFGLATAPQVFTMIVKEVKLMALSRGLRIHQYLDDWLIRSQSQEEAQVNTQAVVELTQSLGWIINQEKSELKPTQVFSFVGYEYHLDSALVKPTQERWLKLQDLILQLKSKRVLTARCLMSLIGLLASTEKMVPEGRLHMRPFQFHHKEHWRYPQSLDNLLPWTEAIAAHLDWWQNPSNVMKGADLHPKDHSIQLFTDASNEGWGAHLDQNFTKGLWSDREKRLHINVLELKAVSLALRDFKDQCQNQTVLVATDNSTVVAYINKQGGTHSAQHDPDPPYYREVALSDMPSQYSEEVDTFRRILSLPDPRESMPRSSTSVLGLDDEKGRQELRPRGPSSILPLSSVIKDAFDKFQHDFKAANLSEGKYVRPPPSTSKWYKVGQPTFQDKIQELNTDFAKICITPRPSGPPVARVPLPVLKELQLQARQNISTLNFTAAFAKTSSSCNASLEKCQHSIKSTVKKIKSQIQKGANPEKAAKRGYEEVADYLDFWNKTVLVQHRALTCLSKSLAHILQRELSSMANTGLLRREAEMTLLHPQLGETRRQELRNSSFWGPSLFESQLVKEGEDFLLKKGTSKDSQGFAPYQNKPFRGPHKKRGSYRKRPYGGNTSQSSNQSFPSGRGKSNFRGFRGRF